MNNNKPFTKKLGHKDYLYHRLLAQELPYSTFRFDFRGNGESTGEPGYANVAVSYLKREREREENAIIKFNKGGCRGSSYSSQLF